METKKHSVYVYEFPQAKGKLFIEVIDVMKLLAIQDKELKGGQK